MVYLKFTFLIGLLLLTFPIKSYDEQLINELVKELNSFVNNWQGRKANHEVDNDTSIQSITQSTTDKNDEVEEEEEDDDVHDNDDNINSDIYGNKRPYEDDILKGQNNNENDAFRHDRRKVPSKSDIIRAIMKDLARERINKKIFFPACSDIQPLILTDSSGVTSSPGFHGDGDGIPSSLNCSWKIIAPKGMVVKITFSEFDLPYTEECSEIFLEIFDIRADTPVSIGKYCGDTTPLELLQSSSQELYIYFVTFARSGRFSFKYETVIQPSRPSSPSCGRPPIRPDSNTLNTRPALAGSWPWMVSIKKLDKNDGGRRNHFCDGLIISPRLVLTTARCWVEEIENDINAVEITASDYDLLSSDDDTQTSRVEELHIHGDYDPSNHANNIALIVVSSPFVFNDRVQATCLTKEGPTVDALCYLTGWGGDNSILQQSRVSIILQTICSRFGGSKLTEKQLCARHMSRKQGTCQNDTGEILVCYNEKLDQWHHHGIANDVNDCKRHEVLTRVAGYFEWISNFTAQP